MGDDNTTTPSTSKKVIGPQLPPHLQKKTFIGPQPPPPPSISPSTTEQGQPLDIGKNSESASKKTAVIGPQIPPHLQSTAATTKPSIGPQLPPHLVQKSQHNTSSFHNNSTSEKRNDEEDSDPFAHLRRTGKGRVKGEAEDLGKVEISLPLDVEATAKSVVESKKIKEKSPVKADDNSREEWMMVPPDISIRPDPLKSRKFNPRVKNLKRDSTWTETPEERMKRLCGEVDYKEDEEESVALNGDDPEEISDPDKVKAEIEEINALQGRSRESLLQQYQKSEKAAAKFQQEDVKSRRFDWQKDMKLSLGKASGSVDQSKMLEEIKQSSSRFSSATKSKSFL